MTDQEGPGAIEPTAGERCPLCGLNPHSLTCMYDPKADPLEPTAGEARLPTLMGNAPDWIRIGKAVRLKETGQAPCVIDNYDTLHEWVTFKGGTGKRWEWSEIEPYEPTGNPGGGAVEVARTLSDLKGDAAFIAAANPETIRALVECVRAADGVVRLLAKLGSSSDVAGDLLDAYDTAREKVRKVLNG